MTPSVPDVDPVDGVSVGGLNRRQMIKAAGIVGAAAWTAPVIIDSLSSPAAAASVAPGCYALYSKVNFFGQWQAWVAAKPTNTGPACAPTGGCAPTTADSTVLAAVNLPTPAAADGSQTLVTVAVAGGYSCRIVGASATVQSGNDADTCNTGVTFGAFGGTSVTVQPTTAGIEWDARFGQSSMIGIIIQCP